MSGLDNLYFLQEAKKFVDSFRQRHPHASYLIDVEGYEQAYAERLRLVHEKYVPEIAITYALGTEDGLLRKVKR